MCLFYALVGLPFLIFTLSSHTKALAWIQQQINKVLGEKPNGKIGRLSKVSQYKVAQTQPWEFCWMHSIKTLFNTLVFTLLYVKIPIQQILHVLLTVGYKFVNVLEVIGRFASLGKNH